MLTSKELSSEYIDAFKMFTDTKKTCPTGKGTTTQLTRQWESVMTTVCSNAKRQLVSYVVALLHENTSNRGELEMFDDGTRLSDCLDPDLLAKLIERIQELGSGGYRWIEVPVTREMTILSDLPLQAQAINLGGVIDLVVVPRDLNRRENVDRVIKQRSRV